ncbi:pyridoxal 5'-phosphate synthase glutaminase subunit PdxT [Populibacterium corticicola]|uniref:Pyridoxal 5'-phosphate synthase subunit PdxT n=1 Tax=Populibacterium corticicola TaxID=1812826 RepID=A0ABW5XAY5_9MICO
MSIAPQVGVLALQGAVSEHADLLTTLGASVVPVRRPSDLSGLSGLVIPGGESTAIARLAAPMGLLPLVRERIDAGSLAVLGTCAGLILLADEVVAPGPLSGFDRVGGLDVVVARNAYGNQLDSFEASVRVSLSDASSGVRDSGVSASRTGDAVGTADASGLDGSTTRTGESTGDQNAHVAFIRAPRIEQVGPRAQAIAWHGDEVVAVAQDRLIGATFHPEITGDLTLHRAFLKLASR